MAIESRPLGFGDLDRNAAHQYPDVDIPASVNGYPDEAIPTAREWNTLGRSWSSWLRHLDQRAPRSDLLSAGDTSLLSAGPLSYAPAAGLTHAVVADSAYVVGGYLVDLPKTRLAPLLLDPYTFTASKWHHFYADGSGDVTVSVVAPATPAAPPPGYVHLGTGKTNATDLTAFDYAAGLSTRRWGLALKVTIDNAADETALAVTGAGTTDAAVAAENVEGGGCYSANIGASSGSCYIAPVGAGASARGLDVTMAQSPAGARGVSIVADALTSGPGLHVQHAGGGAAAALASSGPGGALTVSATTAAPYGATFIGGLGASLRATGVATGHAILAESSTDPTARAIQVVGRGSSAPALSASTPLESTISARAIFGVGSGQAAGIEAQAVNYHALIVRGKAASPVYAELRLFGQDARPSSSVDGGLQWNTSERQLVTDDAVGGGGRGLWSTVGGKVTGHVEGGTASNANSLVWTTVATLVCAGSDAPKTAGTVTLRFRCDARSVSGAAGTLDVRIVDQTAGDVVRITRAGTGGLDGAGYALTVATTDWQRSVALDVVVPIPSGGDRTWYAQVKTATAAQIRVRDAALWPDGAW